MAGKSDHAVDISKAMVVEPVALGDMLVIAPICITIIAGALLLMFRKNISLHPTLAFLALAGLVVSNSALVMRIMDTGPITMTMGRWLPPFGISFSVDLLGATLTLIASVVALAVSIYAAIDIDKVGRRYGFYPFLMLLMTGVSGAFLTGDIFNLYVWFEVLLISSFGLIVLGSEKVQLDGAVKYALLNLIATTLFLVATGYLYGTLGTLNMADITIKVSKLDDTAPINTIAALYALAFAMKAAAFPVNFWLPASYHTPRIVVSAVFAGLLTKVGVYALLRTLVMIMPAARDQYADILLFVAIFTMLAGVLGALAQNDVRRLLGYLVISGIGSMMAGVALGEQLGLSGAILYAIHSIIVMTGLYLALGVVMRLSGGRYNLAELGGAYQASSYLSAIFIVLAFAVAGLPPFSGFWPKVMLVSAALDAEQNLLAGVILLAGLLTSIAIFRVWAHAFWRSGPIGTPDGNDGPALEPVARSDRWSLYLPVTVLTGIVIALGVWPEPVFQVAGSSALGLIHPGDYLSSVFGGAR
ncbi:Na+/H+ antiporter subunit D [Coralliovum pocilloporae]|uniref:Na+/H+ antiporter subunit D n=1 Tax=Coralliovum pocilloporae TaxID=3066369 RepID=UPI00330746BE